MKNNMPLKIVVVEDEPWAASNIVTMLKELRTDIEILQTLDSVEAAVIWFRQHKADLVFLDIHLADGSAFDIFEKVELQTPVIFTTAYDQYAIKAFKVNSVDYLLKPIKLEELETALQKFEKQFSQAPHPSFNFAELAEFLKNTPSYKKRFTVQVGAKIKTILTEDIALFYVLGGDTYLLAKDGHRYDISHSLDKLELLLDPENFLRINRQMILNYSAIDEMYHLSKSRVGIKIKADPKLEVLVSFRKMPEFREWLDR